MILFEEVAMLYSWRFFSKREAIGDSCTKLLAEVLGDSGEKLLAILLRSYWRFFCEALGDFEKL